MTSEFAESIASVLSRVSWATALIGVLMAFFMKEKRRRMGIDIVLWSITLVLATNIVAARLVREAEARNQSNAKRSASHDLQYNHRLDLIEVELQHAWLIYNLPEPINSIARIFEGTPKYFFEQIQASKREMAALSEKHPTDSYLIARLVVLSHSDRDDWTKVIAKFRESSGVSDAFLKAIESIYSAEASKTSGTADAISVIERSPDSWYRTQVLSTAYEIDRSKFSILQNKNAWRCNFGVFVWSFYYLLVTAIYVAGPVAIWKYFKNRRSQLEKPIGFSFRQVYAVVLAFYCTLTIVAFNDTTIGRCFGGMLPPSRRWLDSGDDITVALIEVLLSTVVTIFATWLFALKPDGASWRKMIFGSSEWGLRQIVAYGLGGFLTGVLLIMTMVAVCNLVYGSSGALNDWLVDSFMMGNALATVMTVLAYCLLGPLCEEIIFRLLLYGWMRRRLNVVVSVVAVNIIFAAYHNNVSSFATYFSLGVVYTCVYERTRSLSASVLSHCLWNSFVALAIYAKLCL